GRYIDTELPQTSVATETVVDEALNKENVPPQSNDPPLLRVNTLISGEDNLKFKELMELCTKLSDRVGLSARVESSADEESLGEKDASKQGRISNIDVKQDIYLVTIHRDKDIFGVNDQDDTSMFDADKDLQELVEIKTSKPKVNSIIMQEPSEAPTTTTIPIPLKVQDKGKGIMVEEPLKMKKKDQISFDEEVARKIQEEIYEQERLVGERARKEEEANNTLIETWEDIQAKVDDDYQLRAGDDLEQEIAKKQRIKDENESTDLKRCLEIVPDDGDDVTIDATPLSSKSPTIVDYKIYKEGRKSFFQIIKADGNSQMYLTFSKMLKNFNREDLEVLWSIVKTRFEKTKLVNYIDTLLFQYLKTMFEHHVEDNIWKNQQGFVKVLNWKLFDSYRVYYVTMQNVLS
nr:hypothetical protein [Tanacetum cinerariifolium]